MQRRDFFTALPGLAYVATREPLPSEARFTPLVRAEPGRSAYEVHQEQRRKLRGELPGIVSRDWKIDRATGNIRYVGDSRGPVATVLDLHRWLQDMSDDMFSGDDMHDITDPTASDRTTDDIITLVNGYTINDHAARRLTAGTIIQSNGQEIYESFHTTRLP